MGYIDQRMLKNKPAYFLGAVALALALVPAAHAQAWVYLGSAHVDGAQDHDNIHVGKGKGRFHAIQLRIRDNPIHFERVIVHYGNGQAEPIDIRADIPRDSETRVIDLPGERRFIESVELYYARDSFGGRRPEVKLWGMR